MSVIPAFRKKRADDGACINAKGEEKTALSPEKTVTKNRVAKRIVFAVIQPRRTVFFSQW